MPIPTLNADGLLPEGVHDCTLNEIRDRFGGFQRTDARPRLFERLEKFIKESKASGMVTAIVVDGSFVTAKDAPSDIDLILVTVQRTKFPAVIRPMEYNALSKRHARRRFGFDILLAQEGETELIKHLEFYSKVRDRPDLRKGLLRLWL